MLGGFTRSMLIWGCGFTSTAFFMLGWEILSLRGCDAHTRLVRALFERWKNEGGTAFAWGDSAGIERKRKRRKTEEKTGMGLLLGRQTGVTFSENWGDTFEDFGGRIEVEGKGWF